MTLTKRLIVGFAVLYVAVLLITVFGTALTANMEVRNEIAQQYAEHFRIAEQTLNDFFTEIDQDLLAMSRDSRVTNREDALFTSFLEADEEQFEYDYSPAELDIIKVFNDYRIHHPYVNSVYMGRENGSFVRSHPRSAPTRYDPRERPWYKLAVATPGKVVQTEAYSSVTNEDVNIGSVLTLTDDNGQIYGVLGMDVTLKALSSKMHQLSLAYSGHLEMVDARGIIIMSSESSRLNQEYVEEESYKPVNATSGNLALEKGDTYYRMAYPIRSPEGKLIAYVPVKVVDSQIWQLVYSRSSFVTGILLLVLMINYALLSNLVLTPVKGMHKVLKHSTKKGIPIKMEVAAIAELAQIQQEYNELINMLERDEGELQKIKLLTISSLASLSEMRDYETGLHIVRTQKYVELIASSYSRMFPEAGLTENRIEIMTQCAPLHDIGKVGIPDKILLKPGSLTREEFEIMKNHTVYGREAIVRGNVGIGDQTFIDTAIHMVYSHHERWDGKGYPEGLEGGRIPIEARIMAIADVYDALTSKRVYKDAISHQAAVSILVDGKGTQFDPQLIEAFMAIESAVENVSKIYWE